MGRRKGEKDMFNKHCKKVALIMALSMMTSVTAFAEKKNFNFKDWKIFHQLYKTETFRYYIENFIILNLPFIGKILFKIRHCILKILGKR